jgi:hypothetical protein
MTLGYASRRIADVISCVFNGSTDRPYIGTPFDSDLAGLQVHNGPFDARYGLDGFGDGLGTVAASQPLDVELQHDVLLVG